MAVYFNFLIGGISGVFLSDVPVNVTVHGGFFVLSPKVGAYLKDDTTIWEGEPIEEIARQGNVVAYKHPGFWQPMDTVHDKTVLEDLWSSDSAPWKVWK